jgi:hypothetical protein
MNSQSIKQCGAQARQNARLRVRFGLIFCLLFDQAKSKK